MYIKLKTGQVLSLPDAQAQDLIRRGEAVLMPRIKLKKPEAIINKLGLKVRPGTKITLGRPDLKTTEYFENKGIIKDTRAFFEDKNTPVNKIADLLLAVLDYAIEQKDSFMIQKVSGDLLTLKRLTELYNGKEK